MSLNCVINDLSIRIFGCLYPNGKTELSAALQEATRLSAGSAWIGQMEQREVCQNSVEAPVGERKALRVALAKFNAWKYFLCDRDHLLRKIQADWHCAAFLGGSCYIAGAGAYV